MIHPTALRKKEGYIPFCSLSVTQRRRSQKKKTLAIVEPTRLYLDTSPPTSCHGFSFLFFHPFTPLSVKLQVSPWPTATFSAFSAKINFCQGFLGMRASDWRHSYLLNIHTYFFFPIRTRSFNGSVSSGRGFITAKGPTVTVVWGGMMIMAHDSPPSLLLFLKPTLQWNRSFNSPINMIFTRSVPTAQGPKLLIVTLPDPPTRIILDRRQHYFSRNFGYLNYQR